MKVYSVIYRGDNRAYYLYDREGERIVPPGDPPIMAVGTKYGFRYGFSFHDNWSDPVTVAWAEIMEGLEIEEGFEYFYDAEKSEETTADMKALMSRVTNFWIDRDKKNTATLPSLVAWARKTMVDPERHANQEKISILYTGEEAKGVIEGIFLRYTGLVKGRKHQNYGAFWDNGMKVTLLQLRVNGMKFKDIAVQVGRTNAACRSQYGRIRRGKDGVLIDLDEWEMFRLTLPLGAFEKETSHGIAQTETEEKKL
jgi:hypothetical protein